MFFSNGQILPELGQCQIRELENLVAESGGAGGLLTTTAVHFSDWGFDKIFDQYEGSR
jgi:hypothetical protein